LVVTSSLARFEVHRGWEGVENGEWTFKTDHESNTNVAIRVSETFRYDTDVDSFVMGVNPRGEKARHQERQMSSLMSPQKDQQFSALATSLDICSALSGIDNIQLSPCIISSLLPIRGSLFIVAQIGTC
jgi:hypothetical protein